MIALLLRSVCSPPILRLLLVSQNPRFTDPHALMAQARHRSQAMRKAPTRDRAGHTIVAIYEAVAELLQREGLDNFTTNRIA